jgi:hypothetical protein
MTAQQTVPTTATGARVLADGFFADRSFDYGIRIALGATAYGVGDVGTVLATAPPATCGVPPRGCRIDAGRPGAAP